MGSRGVAVLASIAAVLAVVVAVALMFLFNETPSPAAAPSTPASTPDSTPTVASVMEPTVPFSGDCTQVLTPAQLEALLGPGWRTKDEAYGAGDWPDVWDVALQTGGGLECGWVASAQPAEREGSALDVVVLPASTVPATFATEYAAIQCGPDYDSTSCRVGKVAGDAWVMVRDAAPSPESPSETFLLRALEEVGTTVGSTFDGRRAPRHDAWMALPDCESLGGQIRLHEIIGDHYVDGYWEGSLLPEEVLRREAGLSTTCPWYTGDGQTAPDGGFYIVGATVVPGGAWAWDDIAAFEAATEVPVDGAEAAVVFAEAPNYRLFVSDGVNVISVGGAETSVLTVIAERILAAVSG